MNAHPNAHADHQIDGLLDAAQGPMNPVARDTLLAAVDAGWADPARLHREGRTARRLLDQARAVIADGLGVSPSDLSFCASGPQAARQAVRGALDAARHRGHRTVLSAVEHSALLTPAQRRALAAADDTLIARVPVDDTGRVDVGSFVKAVHEPGTSVAVLQSANGEVGTRQPLEQVHEHVRQAAVPLVVDAQAGLGRDPVPAHWDVLVGDARSFAGPGGIGLLAVRPGARWHWAQGTPDVEHGRAPDTPWVPLALAAAEAFQQAQSERERDSADARELVARLRAIAATIPDTDVVGDPDDRLPHIVTFSVLYVDGETIVDELARAGFAVASGSACTSSLLEPSHVLTAMGRLTHGNVRVTLPLASVSPMREQTVAQFCDTLPAVVARVRDRLGVSGL